MKRGKHLGYLYLHAPDPERPGHHVTYRIVVSHTEVGDEVEDDDSAEDENEPS